MHPTQIQAALKVNGYSQADLACELGVKPSAISMVVNRRGRSAQIEQRIADVTGCTREELWPAWYGKPPLELSEQERVLVLLHRGLQPAAKTAVLSILRDGLAARGFQ